MNSPKIILSDLQRELLDKIYRQKTSSARDKERAGIILSLSTGVSSLKLSKDLGLNRHKVQRCRYHWLSKSSILSAAEEKALSENKRHLLHKAILEALSDAPRSGCPSKFSAEQYCQILGVALENPSDSGHEVTHWSLNILKQEVEKRGIVESISRAQLGAFLKGRGRETS
ncbi:MAG: helix-turn-helix domain-containing protein [Bernardetiaceae bacterium]|nr:helix-turn-helix domain-containing protein [Bernardetiaceae bacterium]